MISPITFSFTLNLKDKVMAKLFLLVVRFVASARAYPMLNTQSFFPGKSPSPDSRNPAGFFVFCFLLLFFVCCCHGSVFASLGSIACASL